MPNSQLILPIALGFSLVTVTALVAYYIFKKDEDEAGGKKIKTSRVNIIEVEVPKSIVPALIGRSGSNIKDIEKKSGALIHFKKFSDKDYDVCIIRGRSQATQLAETLVHEFIKQQPVIVEDTMLVPGWSCGRIIGTGGENINQISHRSGARVKIEGLPMKDNTTERHVSFKGTREQIDNAKKLIENYVAQERCRREIQQSSRSPRHSHSSASPLPPMSLSDKPTEESNASTEKPTAPIEMSSSTTEKSIAGKSQPEDLSGDTTKHVKYKRPETTGAIEVYVSAVSSPSRFWVQLVGPQVAQLDDLVDQMSNYYGDRANREAHALSSVSIGQVVAAVFRHDGKWYRARVHDIRPNEFDATQQVADVFYLDYGDSEYVATHELCELRADLLRLRFQAMECFLAGVQPVGPEDETVAIGTNGQRWPKWSNPAIERFEELTQVARWKSLISRTCTYKKVMAEGDKEKEIPGIKLFDVTEDGEIDIGAVLIQEGHAVPTTPATSPRVSPPRHTPQTPFGDLQQSMVLGMLSGGERSSSVPKDHKHDHNEVRTEHEASRSPDRITTSKSHASGLEKGDKIKAVSNFDIAYSNASSPSKPHLNGSHDLINSEKVASMENVIQKPHSPILSKSSKDEFKANMNRIDSHHGNLDTLGKMQH